MSLVDPLLPEEVRFRRRFMTAALATGAVLAFVMLANPGIDLMLSEALQNFCAGSERARGWCAGWAVDLPRQFFVSLYVIGCAVAGVLVALAVSMRKRWLALDQARCWFLIAVLAVGPGLVANTIFKDNWGRARPRDVVELGGTRQFTPPLLLVTECKRNCSFISGEASSMFALFFAPALLLPGLRLTLLGTAMVFGIGAGLVRMMQGAHFLSDVLFAGVFMALTVGILHLAIIAVWHARSAGLGHDTRPSRPTEAGEARLGADVS